MSISPSVTLKSDSFCFSPCSFPLPLLRSDEPGAHLPFTFFKNNVGSARATSSNASIHLIIPIITMNIPVVIVFFGYAPSSFASNWQLEVVSEVIFFSPVKQPPPPFFSFFLVVFWDVSPGSDASNLPVKIPQQKSSAEEEVVPLESRASSSVLPRGRCHCVCSAATLD